MMCGAIRSRFTPDDPRFYDLLGQDSDREVVKAFRRWFPLSRSNGRSAIPERLSASGNGIQRREGGVGRIAAGRLDEAALSQRRRR